MQQKPALTKVFGAEEAEKMISDARRRHGHEFHLNSEEISPLRGALGTYGLNADDIVAVSKHDTSTGANDPNENRLHHWLQEKMGRTTGLPLAVISQKSLTGHPKGAAAAWQLNGLLQAMADGIIPGNLSLEDVDPQMKDFSTMCFSDRAVEMGPGRVKAGLVTSLGFGHVGGLVCVLHPNFFWQCLSETENTVYRERLHERMAGASRTLQNVLNGASPMVKIRTERPFDGAAGSIEHLENEASMLLNATARLKSGSNFSPVSED